MSAFLSLWVPKHSTLPPPRNSHSLLELTMELKLTFNFWISCHLHMLGSQESNTGVCTCLMGWWRSDPGLCLPLVIITLSNSSTTQPHIFFKKCILFINLLCVCLDHKINFVKPFLSYLSDPKESLTQVKGLAAFTCWAVWKPLPYFYANVFIWIVMLLPETTILRTTSSPKYMLFLFNNHILL